MKKILFSLALLAIFLVSAIAVYEWHEVNERAWWRWKEGSLAISEHMYKLGKNKGWSKEKIDSLSRDSIYNSGLRKPGLCLYCEIRNILK